VSDQQPRDADFEAMPTRVIHWYRFTRLPAGGVARVLQCAGCLEHPRNTVGPSPWGYDESGNWVKLDTEQPQ
jgi:hypothetical protein